MSTLKGEAPKKIPEKRVRRAVDAWWYADKGGIDVLVRTRDNGDASYVRLRWSELLKARRRYG